MRDKVYYLHDEITTNLYTTGSEWMLENDTQYIGTYHSYSTGEVYTQPKWDPAESKKLIPLILRNTNTSEYTILKPDIKTTYKILTQTAPRISAADVTQGFITRYIVQNVSTKAIYEVGADQFKLYSSKKADTNLYSGVSIKWFITGARYSSDQSIGSIIQKTVSQKNSEQLTIASKTIPYLHTHFTNLEEFYSDSTYIVTPDINGLE